MLQNVIVTTFTISELLRENQQGGRRVKFHPTTRLELGHQNLLVSPIIFKSLLILMLRF